MFTAKFSDIHKEQAHTTPRDGWSIDEDDWHVRHLRSSDRFKVADFDNSVNAFIQDGKLYCRNANQAAKLDAGRVV